MLTKLLPPNRRLALHRLCVSELNNNIAAPPQHVRTCVQVAVACHVPKTLAEEKELGVKEWFDTVTKAMGGEVEVKEESDECIIAICKGSKEKELFPLKMRDAGSSAGYQMLLKKGLIPDNGAPARRAGARHCAVACHAGPPGREVVM